MADTAKQARATVAPEPTPSPADLAPVREWVADALSRVEVLLSPPRPVGENVELDELMLRAARSTGRVTFRLWWGTAPTVVLGSSEDATVVAYLRRCAELGVEVLKRTSGGGAILQTEGVLNYALVAPAPTAIWIKELFLVSSRILIEALGLLGLAATQQGTSDVTVGDLKVSGNAMARRAGGILVHGTLLYDIDIELVEASLRHPPREPEYRRGRSHRDFITTLRNLGVKATKLELEQAVIAALAHVAAHPELIR